MEPRYKKMGDQLGKSISSAGSHIPHVVVGILRTTRKKKEHLAQAGKLNGGSNVKPLREYDPFPAEFLPGSY